MCADKTLPPLFDYTVDPQTRITHVAIRMPDTRAVRSAMYHVCSLVCETLFWSLVRGVHWAMLAVGSFMLVPGIALLVYGVYTPVLYSVVALLTLSLGLSLAFRLSELTSGVDPQSDDRQCELVAEFAGRACFTAVTLVFAGMMIMALVSMVMILLGH